MAGWSARFRKFSQAVSNVGRRAETAAVQPARRRRYLVMNVVHQQSQFAGIATLINALSSRITTLEQAGATNQGKQIFQDPAIASLITEVRSLRESRVVGQGVDSGRGDVVGWIVGGLGLMALIIGAMTAIISLLMRRSTV